MTETFAGGLKIKAKSLTKDPETQSKTLHKGFKIETKILQKALGRNNGQQKTSSRGIHCNLQQTCEIQVLKYETENL